MCRMSSGLTKDAPGGKIKKFHLAGIKLYSKRYLLLQKLTNIRLPLPLYLHHGRDNVRLSGAADDLYFFSAFESGLYKPTPRDDHSTPPAVWKLLTNHK